MATVREITSTPEEREAIALQLLPVKFAQLEDLVKRSLEISVQPGSRMAQDDKATPYDPISFQVAHLLASASDHLTMAKEHVEKIGLPPYAWHVLIRAALESCALGFWLLTPGVLSKRVYRSVQFVWNNRLAADAFTKRSGAHTPETTAKLRERLDAIKNSVKGNAQRSLDREFPSTTDILIESERCVPIQDGFSGLDVWRACSAFSHSNRTFALGTLERKPVARLGENASMFRITSSYATFVAMLNVALTYLETLLVMVETRSKA
ncbi:hypothetical protein ABH923_003514 [Leifsonia sp. EB41]|uniref:hypothetical protein n=1 Tax=Leifsonia sp. EB41 TaxID=3156260 RepID=UPI0035190053